MQRREFTAGLLFAAATRPAWAQQRATPPRIAIFHPAIPVALLPEAGLVTSLARPGGNLTGITLDPGVEIWAKRLELLKEAIPSTARVAFLAMREGWDGSFGQLLQDAGSRLGISLISMIPNNGTPSEIERVFAAMAEQRPDAVLVSGEGDLYANRLLIAELAEKTGLPTICPYRDYVEVTRCGGSTAARRARAAANDSGGRVPSPDVA